MEFDDFTLDEAALELRHAGRRVDLSPQGVRLLIALFERRGELVTRQELYRVLWPDETDVDVDRGLNTLIRQVRHALGDTPARARFIRTYPRRGYRFLADDASATADRRRARRTAPPLVLAALLLAVALAGLLSRRHDPERSVPRAARESFELGKHLLASPKPARRAEAVPWFADAATLAPNSARVQAHLADALLWAGRATEAEEAAARALSIDAAEPHALFISGVLSLIRDWNWERAEFLLRSSVTRDTEQALYQVVLAFVLSTAGRSAEAVRLLDAARTLDPPSAIVRADIGMIYLYAGQPGKAAEACERAAEMEPGTMYSHDCALAARSLLGDLEAARRHAAAMLRLAGWNEVEVMGDTSEPAATALARYHGWDAARAALAGDGGFGAALSFAQAGRPVQALEALGRAAAKREMGFVTITVDPRLAALRGDAAFQRLSEPLVERGALPPAAGIPRG